MSAPVLTLSTGGIETTKTILAATAMQRRVQELQERGNAHEASTTMGVINCNRVEALWRAQGRQVLSMHPDLTAEVRLATSTKIEPEVFRTLPYINPLVVFPGGVEVPTWRKSETIRTLGFFAYGRDGKYVFPQSARAEDLSEAFDRTVQVLSTHDPDAQRFALIIINEVTGHDGVVEYEYNRVSFRLDITATLSDHVDHFMRSFGWDDNTIGSGVPLDERADRRKFMRVQLGLALGSVMYLCSTVLDAEAVPKSRIRRAWGKTTRQVPNLINVGWRIGPALSAARAQARTKEATSLPGRSLPPHQRRAHFKTVWTGPGRSVPKTVFIAPYWVRKDLMHLVDTKTVRAVR
jgi:hypothetical protein